MEKAYTQPTKDANEQYIYSCSHVSDQSKRQELKLKDKQQTIQGQAIFGTYDGSVIVHLISKNKPIKRYPKMLNKANQDGYKYVSSITTFGNGKYSIICNLGGQVVEQDLRSGKVMK